MDIEELIATAIVEGASDIHLQSGQVPYMRVRLSLQKMTDTPIQEKWLQQWMANHRDGWSFSWQQVRCRCQVCMTENGMYGVIRLLYPLETLPEDEQPITLAHLSCVGAGLVLICGPTRSGKTTTVCRVLQGIMSNKPYHIITLEDPIEYILKGKKALITQREIGSHVSDFDTGIVQSLRQDPDVLFIGEIRNRETMRAAIMAAETGITVFATMHSPSVMLAINRAVGMFEGSEQEEIRQRLAVVLKAVVAQKFMEKENKLHLLREQLWTNSAVAAVIRSGQFFRLTSIMQTGSAFGMETMEQALNRYWREV
ncbi:type IV pilus twitching motility protein PilT [uncultured Megasphaera sp.]|uniref:type IV pilus twitching motility protein PilT n=1 Tax=uncultured Megasphaera sp. TaxID=165188 RepID=UPI0025990DC7|nr:ATPase, T2SS/T4P/T4SS family [uncultured Megasphaera sp.]